MGKTMVKTHYGCKGSCGGEVTEEQFNAGKKTCGDKSCDQYGKPLEKMSYCSGCSEYYTQKSADQHADCGC
jgi:hypothetical protein